MKEDHQCSEFNAIRNPELMVIQDQAHDNNERQTASALIAIQQRSIIGNQQYVEFAK